MSRIIFGSPDGDIVQSRRAGKRVGMALVLAAIALFSYFSQSSTNPITGETQRVALSFDQEIALGLQSAPQMAAQHGGLDRSSSDQAVVDRIGNRLLTALGKETPYKFDFHLLADPKTVNAFALPGGQVFITRALFNALETEGQLAGVLGHEIGHVLERHSAQQLAKAQLTQGLTGAAAMAAYDPSDARSQQAQMVAMMVGKMVNMKFGRDDEIESDRWGVTLTARAGYDPRAMIGVMKVLEHAAGGGNTPEFFSTHPNPENRIEHIQQVIAENFPQGLPGNLIG